MVKFNVACICKDDKAKKNAVFSVEQAYSKEINGSVNKNSPSDSSCSHVNRRKTHWELSRLTFSMMGIEVVYSVATSVMSPLLLLYGMKREQVVLVWAISPILGFLFSPILGSLSDRCKSSIGRRRPFIILLAALNLLGLMFVANSYIMGHMLGDNGTDILSQNSSVVINELSSAEVQDNETNLDDYLYTVIFLIVGTILTDFSSDTLLNPCRAYVLDVCEPEDHRSGLSTSMKMAGIGSFIGYFIGYIDWNKTFLSKILGSYVRIIFSLVALIFTACMLVTITSFKEVPLTKSKRPSVSSTNESDQKKKTRFEKMKRYLKSIIVMPYPLRLVYITNLLCCIAHVNFYLYFTHFVGSAVFNGDPSAPPNTEAKISYLNGVRFACLALSGNSVISILYSLVSSKIIKKFGLKYVYTCTIFLDAFSLLVMAILKTKTSVMIVSAVSGIMYCSLFTIPYMLVANYHSKNMFIDKNGAEKQTRGLGTDLSMVGSCICVAQIITSLCMGQLMTTCGVTFAVIGTSSILGFLALLTASQIIYSDCEYP